MSCSVQWHSLPSHPIGALQESAPQLCVLCTPSCSGWALITVGRSMRGIYTQANGLQGMVTTMVEDWLCRSWLHGELNLVGLRYRLSPPLQCVTYESVWVVLQHVLKFSTGCAGSGASCEVQVKVSCHLCPARVNLAWATEQSSNGCYFLLDLEVPRWSHCEPSWLQICQAWVHWERSVGYTKARYCWCVRF